MHPILARRERLVIYLLVWVVIGVLLEALLMTAGHTGWLETLSLVAPLCVIYALFCLAAWYPVAAIPIEGMDVVPRALVAHLTAALLLSIVWTALGAGLAYLLGQARYFSGFYTRFRAQVPLLLGAGVLLYLLSVVLHYALVAFEASRQAEKREDEARVLARDAELKALKAQVNPHFLFNSLNSISALTSVDPSRAREMCILLSEFLRTTLGLGEKAAIPLEEELSLIRSFLAVEKVRFGARLCVEEAIAPECLSLFVPPLLLQPLVENAVGHGIGNLLEGGVIRLEARIEGDRLVIVVANSYDPDSVRSHRNGLGLANVRNRIQMRYGSIGALHVRTADDRFEVEIAIPAETEAL
ncbi:MAG TPA: histidine kinase [Bryobacteraceae bacterium]|nr:histidine kinase [Bryobacteraceae bacterium]